jgi:hypothetical protein
MDTSLLEVALDTPFTSPEADALVRLSALVAPKERKGSRLRCLLLTEGDDNLVARRIAALAAPFATVEPEPGGWLPRGFTDPRELDLAREDSLLGADRDEVVRWWLATARSARTPSWDIASRALVSRRPGMILVEAKAHAGELSAGGGRSTDAGNQERIAAAIRSANEGLESALPGWGLVYDRHYQLSNRFAWAWKLASLGLDVVLVYLGFLGCTEMVGCRLLGDSDTWNSAVREHARGVVPEQAWGRRIAVGDGSLLPLIRTARIPCQVGA